ncbi:MAG: hypothetical protein DBX91_07505 [Subdoligranulum variabile]|nr:MAG: hypothetical protein DBX91_07505 [Subdoligranulum variabile]
MIGFRRFFQRSVPTEDLQCHRLVRPRHIVLQLDGAFRNVVFRRPRHCSRPFLQGRLGQRGRRRHRGRRGRGRRRRVRRGSRGCGRRRRRSRRRRAGRRLGRGRRRGAGRQQQGRKQ